MSERVCFFCAHPEPGHGEPPTALVMNVGDHARRGPCKHDDCRCPGFVEGRGDARVLYACGVCGSTEIQGSAWIDLNSGKDTGDDPPTENYWCPDCHEHQSCVCSLVRVGVRKVVCQFHGESEGPFCVPATGAESASAKRVEHQEAKRHA